MSDASTRLVTFKLVTLLGRQSENRVGYYYLFKQKKKQYLLILKKHDMVKKSNTFHDIRIKPAY